MTASLEHWASDALCTLPDVGSSDEVTLRADSLPRLPEHLTTDQLVVARGFHDYDTWRIDYLQWYSHKETYGALGLVILAAVFRQRPCCINLTNPASDITLLIIDTEDVARPEPSLPLRVNAVSFTYCPSQLSRHPWYDVDSPQPSALPWFKLTNADDMVVGEEARDRRDCVRAFGGLQGSVRAAELLLNLSRPCNDVTEVALESEAGFRGVAPMSTEARFWLPGSDDWRPEYFKMGV